VKEYMKHTLLLILLLSPFISQSQRPDEDSIAQRIVLIGDAGWLDLNRHHAVVEAVEKSEKLDQNTTVIYLGDNLYRHGLPYEQMAQYGDIRAVLDSQANIADHGPKMVYFIPGNHDWMNGQQGGLAAVLRQERYLNSLGKKNLKFLPRDGCPGPEEIDLGNDVVLVIMDTQWWLHKNSKPGIESDCEVKTRDELLNELQDIFNRNYRKLILFAVHHPFKSNGVHGGYFTPKQHLFPFTDINKSLYIPLPVLGSVYPISRQFYGSIEDIPYPDYQNMIAQIKPLLLAHPNVIHVAGHEHALEWLVDSNINYIVSGSGCKSSRVSKSRKAKFVAEERGWATLEIHKNKTVTCTFRGADGDSAGRVLFTDRVLDYSKLPPEPQPDTSTPLAIYKDSALVPASRQYDSASWFRRLTVGENYRKEWSEPVWLKLFHLNKVQGGLRITGAGGGFQTKSLRMVDKNGRQFNLRTIDKDPRKVLPASMRGTFARDVVQDMISAAHPYAPMTIWPLANAAGIIAPRPQYFYVPDDPALGFYRPLFANKVCLLEPADPTPDGTESKSSSKVINKMIGDDDHFIDQKAVLRARLLDMMVGDWDRHLDQWRWGIDDTGRGKLYYPIPRDRDQAFFNSDGLIMKFTTMKRLPWMRGFKHDFHKFKWLSYSPRNFDRIFMNQLTKHDWDTGIKEFQNMETDDAIHDAVGQMPPQIRAIRGAEIEGKLLNRRNNLYENGMRYYDFLSREVQILGSNQSEQFNITQSDSGILVQVHVKEKNKDTSLLRYSRVFDPKVTKEIRLFGFNGADRFEIDPSVRTNMRIRMIGGGGADTFNVAGKAHSHIYDVTTEQNQVLASRHTRSGFTDDPTVNDWQAQEFSYNFLRLPTIGLGYNPDDGVLLGLGVWRRTYGWRKVPYETDNKLGVLVAVARQAFQLNYHGIFVQSLWSNDLLLDAQLQRPALRNFFGLGNETKSDADLKFYRARYNSIDADVLIQKRLFGILRMATGPVYSYYSIHGENNESKVLEEPEFLGLDSSHVYSRKQYLGGRLFTDVNNVNSELFPTRGVSWHNELNVLAGLNDNSRPYTEFHSDMNIYASLSDPAKLVAVVRLGGGHIFSKDFEFFQAMSVGQNNYLRGFRKNRFSGRSLAYTSLELRAKLFDIKNYILPGAIGLVGFDDVARVWSDGENSKRWHNTFGGGIYYVPYNMFLVSATTAYSPEGMLFNLTIGTKFNLTF
jgi:hypothetical protein